MKVLSTTITSPLTLPTGETYTMEELVNMAGFETLRLPCVLNIGAGILTSMEPISSIAIAYDIDAEDPAEIFEIYLEKLEEQKNQASQAQENLEHLQYQTDLNSKVLNELLEMM